MLTTPQTSGIEKDLCHSFIRNDQAKELPPYQNTHFRLKIVFRERSLIPAVKHVCGNVLIWGCFNASGATQLAVIDSTRSSAWYQKKKLKENVSPSVQKFNWKWTFQHDNDLLCCSTCKHAWCQHACSHCMKEWSKMSPSGCQRQKNNFFCRRYFCRVLVKYLYFTW